MARCLSREASMQQWCMLCKACLRPNGSFAADWYRQLHHALIRVPGPRAPRPKQHVTEDPLASSPSTLDVQLIWDIIERAVHPKQTCGNWRSITCSNLSLIARLSTLYACLSVAMFVRSRSLSAASSTNISLLRVHESDSADEVKVKFGRPRLRALCDLAAFIRVCQQAGRRGCTCILPS